MSLILTPGQAPPDITPYCQRCDMPVEFKRFNVVAAHGEEAIVVHARCCGYESSSRIPLSAYLRMRKTGEKWYAIVNKGRAIGLRDRPKHNPALWLPR